MATIAEQLEQLESDRQDLVDNLETQGITGLTGDETFTELVPEVLNISGGGYTVPSDFNELRSFLDTLSTEFVNKLYSDIDNREAYTSNSVILRTPDINYKLYVIQKRSSGKYRVVWFNCPFVLQSAVSSFSAGSSNGLTSGMNVSGDKITSIYIATSNIVTNNSNGSYYSNEVNTPADVIDGMINNTLTYTYIASNFAMVEDSPYVFPYSNTIIFSSVGHNNSTVVSLPSKIISHNETFQSI